MGIKTGTSLGLVLLGSLAWAGGEPPAPVPVLRLTWDRFRGGCGMEAREAPLEQLAHSLARVSGCAVELDEKLRGRRVTLDLAPRPLERLFPVLARRLDARLSILYRLKPWRAEYIRRKGSLVFAGRLVDLEMSRPLDLDEALRQLGVPLEVEDGVSGRVRLSAARYPLARVFDRIADQVNAKWETVVRLEQRKPVDAEAAALERMHSHFGDLAGLSPGERREELASDLEAMLELPGDQREQRLERISTDILSLASLLQSVPGEHRAQIGPRVHAVAGDYWSVLSRLPEERRSLCAPLFAALEGLRQRLDQIR
jgi:hypothetical protein